MNGLPTQRRHWRGAWLAAALWLGACATQPPEDPDRESSERQVARLNTQLGAEYIARGQYEVALDKLKKAVRSDATYAPAHTVLAVLYEQLGEEDLANRHYRDALRLKPDDGEINNNYGTYLCRTGQGNDADPYFEKALEDPFYRTPAVALANAGLCALNLGELDKAESYLRKSLEYNAASPDALLPLAVVAYRKQDFLRARGFLQRYEAVAPETAESLVLGYRLETSLSNQKNARRYRDLLMERFPNAPETKELKAEPRQ